MFHFTPHTVICFPLLLIQLPYFSLYSSHSCRTFLFNLYRDCISLFTLHTVAICFSLLLTQLSYVSLYSSHSCHMFLYTPHTVALIFSLLLHSCLRFLCTPDSCLFTSSLLTQLPYVPLYSSHCCLIYLITPRTVAIYLSLLLTVAIFASLLLSASTI